MCVCVGESQAAWEIMILYDCTARQKKPHTQAHTSKSHNSERSLFVVALVLGKKKKKKNPIHFLNGKKKTLNKDL